MSTARPLRRAASRRWLQDIVTCKLDDYFGRGPSGARTQNIALPVGIRTESNGQEHIRGLPGMSFWVLYPLLQI